MLDIDHFKLVNDNYGHAMGDQVIKAVAVLLRQRLRRSDIIGRYGGEEFVAILPGCDIEAVRHILEHMRTGFSALHFIHAGQQFACTLSMGFACSAQYPHDGGADLLITADQALYAAKRGGRNQIRAADPAQRMDKL